MKALWTEERANFSGNFYSLIDAYCEPKPVQTPHIPIWVGGSGPKMTLRVVARHADGWNTFMQPREDYQILLGALERTATAPGATRRASASPLPPALSSMLTPHGRAESRR